MIPNEKLRNVALRSLLLGIVYVAATFSYSVSHFFASYSDNGVFLSTLNSDGATQAAIVILLFIAKTTILTLAIFLSSAILGLVFFDTPFIRQKSRELPEALSVLSVLITCLILHFWNSKLFPHSLWAEDYGALIDGIVVYIGTPILTIIIFIGLKRTLTNLTRHIRKSVSISIILFLTLYIASVAFDFQRDIKQKKREFSGISPTQFKPDIYIIGVDSLRLDQLAINGGASWVTPNINQVLSKSSIFQHAYTPIARTFPAWVSILSGKNPSDHSVRFNLAEIDIATIQSDLITTELKKRNYVTIFATDERRFSNVDKEFGFDSVIGPSIGLTDFIEGSINDFPINNLLLFTSISDWLYPSSKLNRANSVTYSPSDFTNKVTSAIDEYASNEQPVFFAVHFCLPHWPYSWRQSNRSHTNRLEKYQAALNRTDAQIGRVLHRIKQTQREAILVLLSDHGEAIGLRSDIPRNISPNVVFEEVRYGHGTNISSLSQYKVLLAFSLINSNASTGGPNRISQLASLADVKHTIEGLLNYRSDRQKIQNPKSVSFNAAMDLSNWILGIDYSNTDRTLLLETGILIPAIIKPKLEKMAAFKEGVHQYRVTEDARLVIKRESEKTIVSNKSFALVRHDSIYTATKTPVHYILRTIDPHTNTVINSTISYELPKEFTEGYQPPPP